MERFQRLGRMGGRFIFEFYDVKSDIFIFMNKKKSQNFGRPINVGFENLFMSRIREIKGQILHSESQFEVSLIGKYRKNNKSQKEQKQNPNQNNPPKAQLSIDDFLHKLAKNINFDLDHSRKLYHRFNEIKKQWEYQEFQQDQPLPDILVDDEFDISYTLHELHKAKDIDLTRVDAKDLLFLLFCKISTKFHSILNFSYIDYFQRQWDFMVDILQHQLDFIKENMAKEKNNEGQKEKQKKPKKVKKTKSKKISKGKESKQKKNEQQENDEVPKQDGEQTEKDQTDQDKEYELACKACVYIYWAYRYALQNALKKI